MSISFCCPECSDPVQVGEELAGLRGRCPRCKAPITMPATSELTSEQFTALTTALKPVAREKRGDARPYWEKASDEPAYTTRGSRVDWQITLHGLQLERIGVLILLALSILSITPLIWLIALFAPWVIPVVFLAAVLLCFVGRCLCCTSPKARGIVFGSVIFFAMVLFIDVALMFHIHFIKHPVQSEDLVQAGILLIAVALGGWISHLFFVFYTDCVASHFDDDRLAKSVLRLLAAELVFVVSWITLWYFYATGGMPPGLAKLWKRFFAGGEFGYGTEPTWADWSIIIMVIGGAVALAIWYLEVLGRTRKLILKATSEW